MASLRKGDFWVETLGAGGTVWGQVITCQRERLREHSAESFHFLEEDTKVPR